MNDKDNNDDDKRLQDVVVTNGTAVKIPATSPTDWVLWLAGQFTRILVLVYQNSALWHPTSLRWLWIVNVLTADPILHLTATELLTHIHMQR